MRLLAGIILIAASLAVPISSAHADTIHLTTGEASKVVKVRLQGVAAPERSDVGGSEATRFVEQLAEGRQVRCELDGSRSKDRVVGVRFVGGDGGSSGGQDIGAAVIAAGRARDCPRYSGGRYKALERPEAAGLPYPSYCVPRAQKGAAATEAPSAVTAPEPLDSINVALNAGTPQVTPHVAPQVTPQVEDVLEHGGGLNGCGCHFNRKTGECHCHRGGGCGCACEAPSCGKR